MNLPAPSARSLPRRFGMRILAAAAALTMVVAGCSSDDASEGSATITEGTLTVGVPTFPPFIALEDGVITGPDGAIINELAKRLELEIEPVPFEFSALIPALQQNRVDVALGSVFRTEERAKVITFSDPLYLEPGSIISKTDITNLDAFIGQNVGTIQGYNWVADIQEILGDQELRLYPSSVELKQDLDAGRIDIGIDSYGTAIDMYRDTDFYVTPLPEDERVQAAIQPGQTALLFNQSNTELLEAMNEKIAELHAEGLIAQYLEEAGLDPEAANTGEPRMN